MPAERENAAAKTGSAPPLFVVDIGRAIAYLISRPLWFITFEGTENIPSRASGPLIIASNHQTYIDPVWICIPIRRRFRFMAYDQAFRWPWIGPLIRFLGAFPVRHPVDVNPGAVKNSLRALRNGESLVIFPEGAREFADGEIRDFKHGAAMLAGRSGIPVLPVTILGGNRIWPQGQKWPCIFRRVRIRYHPVLPVDETESPEEWTARLKDVIRI